MLSDSIIKQTITWEDEITENNLDHTSDIHHDQNNTLSQDNTSIDTLLHQMSIRSLSWINFPVRNNNSASVARVGSENSCKEHMSRFKLGWKSQRSSQSKREKMFDSITTPTMTWEKKPAQYYVYPTSNTLCE